jgi:CRP/FNR family cyclic AMP-dependent transcriptional regulator
MQVCDDSAKHPTLYRPEILARVSDGQDNGSGMDTLNLFASSVRWQQTADPGAGWDLIKGLRSSDRSSRVLAASLLAKTKHCGIRVRHLRRAARGWSVDMGESSLTSSSRRNGIEMMNTPYGLEITDSCLSCKLRRNSWFCGLSPEMLKSLSSVSHLTTYPSGALLFVEGQTPRGVSILCSGKVKLSTSSREGKVLMLKIAEAGAVLGLSAVVAGEPYELTAETAVPCQVNFVEREALLRLIEKHGELGLRATQLLSREFQAAYRDMQDLILARSSAGKLARLLLSWTPGQEANGPKEVRIRSGVTHEEMAQMIGASRETVTRLLSDLKKKELIRLEGSTLVIRNRGALETMAA